MFGASAPASRAYVRYIRRVSDANLRARKAVDLPKTFLRLLTKSKASDFPMTLAKWFFAKSLIDSKGLAFYHYH